MQKHSLQYLKAELNTIEDRIGYTFSNKDLLVRAFTHRSFVNENRSDVDEHNERLEFLGDAVLELIVSKMLYDLFPEKPEGELSENRARIIEANACHSYMSKLDVSDFLLMGKGERANIGRGRETIIADLFEALIGAIYIDSSFEAVRDYFIGTFKAEALRLVKKRYHNWKAELQDYSQKRFKEPPDYRVVREEGPDHLKIFDVEVYVNGELFGKGTGNAKKEAEQNAAENAVKQVLNKG